VDERVQSGTFRGGYYLDTHINGQGCEYKTGAHNARYHDYSTGFRCCQGGLEQKRVEREERARRDAEKAKLEAESAKLAKADCEGPTTRASEKKGSREVRRSREEEAGERPKRQEGAGTLEAGPLASLRSSPGGGGCSSLAEGAGLAHCSCGMRSRALRKCCSGE
jgi:hypothetical protein